MFTYDFLGYDELLFVALAALVLVLANLWTFVRYGLARSQTPVAVVPATPVATAPPRPVIPPIFAGTGPLRLAAPPRAQLRRRYVPKVLRPGHRPVKPQQA